MDPLGRRHASGLAAAARRRCRSPTCSRTQVAESGRAWIFTSATLAVGSDFSLYQRELGLADAATGCWESPFDYASQALLYVPRGLPRPTRASTPRPSSPRRCRCCGRAAAARSCCSRRCARSRVARELLADAFAREGLDVAAAGPGRRLAQRAPRRGSASSATPCCSAARASGKASTCRARRCPSSIIDKLPFAPPDDPLLAARLEQLARRRRQSVLRLPVAAGGDRAEAGRGPADPHRDRSRRADDLRPAAHRQALRQAHLAEPAADAAHAGARRTSRRSSARTWIAAAWRRHRVGLRAPGV